MHHTRHRVWFFAFLSSIATMKQAHGIEIVFFPVSFKYLIDPFISGSLFNDFLFYFTLILQIRLRSLAAQFNVLPSSSRSSARIRPLRRSPSSTTVFSFFFFSGSVIKQRSRILHCFFFFFFSPFDWKSRLAAFPSCCLTTGWSHFQKSLTGSRRRYGLMNGFSCRFVCVLLIIPSHYFV